MDLGSTVDANAALQLGKLLAATTLRVFPYTRHQQPNHPQQQSQPPDADEWKVTAESGSSEFCRKTLADFRGYYLGFGGAALQ
jgi:hypothetical protein